MRFIRKITFSRDCHPTLFREQLSLLEKRKAVLNNLTDFGSHAYPHTVVARIGGSSFAASYLIKDILSPYYPSVIKYNRALFFLPINIGIILSGCSTKRFLLGSGLGLTHQIPIAKERFLISEHFRSNL
jgi:hypothetical protein